MSFNWRWLFLIMLLGLKPPQFDVDPYQLPDHDSNVLPFPTTVSLMPYQPVDLLVEDQCFVKQLDSAGENTRECPASLHSIAVPTMHPDACLLPDICRESDHPLTGMDPFEETTRMKGNVSSALMCINFTTMIREVGLQVRAFSETIMNMLLQKWQPGSVLQRAKDLMSLTPLLDVLFVSLFIWKRFKSLTSSNQTTRNNSNESSPDISVLAKKLIGMKGRLRRTKWMLSASHRCNRKLKKCIWELERTSERTTEERDSLNSAMKEREERIKSDNLERATILKRIQEREMALQQKLDQLVQDWSAKLDDAMRDRREYEERVKEEIQNLRDMMDKTSQTPVPVFQTKKEIIENAACDFIVARRKMNLSWQKHHKST